jgi:hypothetical protein
VLPNILIKKVELLVTNKRTIPLKCAHELAHGMKGCKISREII